ncbi:MULTISPECIES: EAL domain-containing protein [Enterobacter]|uniref:EAL domain-containing protein n=1 Tax=Enterobacter TaxID=547 RepID=UPI0007ADBDFA|nr:MULTISPECIES: EAL domain-containing protein [Enterobacter]AMZ77775.1 hypothetical protein A4308_12515 [Enterobacter sp. ODB01]EKS6337606.1 EAL domain-containing protein [Enterobacter hormaechei]VAL43372.1 diguanylate phosphodiesterase [Enterobacter kobei]
MLTALPDEAYQAVTVAAGLSGLLLSVFLVRLWCSPLARLRRATRSGHIQPWYQPVVSSATGEISGCEVLARWTRTGKAVLPASAFIPLAERSGWIVPLTRCLMRQVERDLVPVMHLLPEGFHIAINICTAHAQAPGFIQDCLRLQNAFAGCRARVVVEITERARPEATPAMLSMLEKLRIAGIRVALDDFGTEYASLVSLDALPVNYIKLDRYFTARIREDRAPEKGCLMAEVITDLARQLGLEVVAEGVETTWQKDWLTRHGVHWLQGYYFSPPLEAAAFIRWLFAGRGGRKGKQNGG